MSTPIVIIQGGQYGSEGKGQIAAKLCVDRNIGYAVRTGAINAGHTVIVPSTGQAVKMQLLPTGWINPGTRLVIGAGAYIHIQTLEREIELVNAVTGVDVRNRLYIDRRCGLHHADHERAAGIADRHHRIGATGKGCSEAIVDKIRNRGNGYRLFGDTSDVERLNLEYTICDTSHLLNDAYDVGASILIEGTQGTGLDMHLGPYPYTTSRMTTAANWVAECGLAPGLQYETVLVMRTHPIRVAGNSGPMVGEMDWHTLAGEINGKLTSVGLPPRVNKTALFAWEQALVQAADYAATSGRYQCPIFNSGQWNVNVGRWSAAERSEFRMAASELHRDALALLPANYVSELQNLFEMTTVTKKLRRVAALDTQQVFDAVQINRPAWICLTFLNYVFPQLWHYTAGSRPAAHDGAQMNVWLEQARQYVSGFAILSGAPVGMVSTGPGLEHVLPTTALAALPVRTS